MLFWGFGLSTFIFNWWSIVNSISSRMGCKFWFNIPMVFFNRCCFGKFRTVNSAAYTNVTRPFCHVCSIPSMIFQLAKEVPRATNTLELLRHTFRYLVEIFDGCEFLLCVDDNNGSKKLSTNPYIPSVDYPYSYPYRFIIHIDPYREYIGDYHNPL